MQAKWMVIGLCAATALACSSSEESPLSVPDSSNEVSLGVLANNYKPVDKGDIHIRMILSVLPKSLRRQPPLFSSITWLVMTERPGKRCNVRFVGETCMIRDCRPELGSLPLTGSGVITVSSKGNESIILEPLESGAYLPWHSPRTLMDHAHWQAGDRVNVSSTGNYVPAFSVTGTFPAEISVQMPDLSRPIVINRDRPLQVEWEPSGQSVVVSVVQAPPIPTAYWAAREDSCTFPGKPGSGVVPSSLLSKLFRTTGETNLVTTVYVGGVSLNRVEPEGIDVSIYFARLDWQRAILL